MDVNLLIMDQDQIVLSTDGYSGNAEPIVACLLLDDDIVQSYIAGSNLYPYLARINKVMQDSVPGWKMRISGKRRYQLIGQKTCIAGSFFVDYISVDMKSGKDGDRKPRRRIDIINLELILDHPPIDPADQFRMAMAIVDLQRSRGITRLKTTRGAIGAALLRRSPEWEKKRHAAPRFVNEFSRKHLPGNYYALSAEAEKRRFHTYEHCYYIDQHSSHHNIAKSIKIPHPHYIRGRGFYSDALTGEKDYYPIWCKANSSTGNRIQRGELIGLFLARVSYTTPFPASEQHLYPPWAKSRQNYVWLWSPDIRFICANHRIKLDSFVAGFCADTSDPAITEYAKFSLDYLRENSRDKAYTKSTLLAAYGMLGFNNQSSKAIYKYWGGSTKYGTKVVIPEAGTVTERKIEFKDGIQHSLVNVIARGLIESETRRRTLEFSKRLHESKYKIVQIYADGVLVYTDSLPLLPPEWRVTDSLTNVYIPRPNAFISDEITKIPGVPLEEDEIRWLDIREKSRKPLTARA